MRIRQLRKRMREASKCAMYEELLTHFPCVAFSYRGCSTRKIIADPLCLFFVYRTISLCLSAGSFVLMSRMVRHRGLLDMKNRSRERESRYASSGVLIWRVEAIGGRERMPQSNPPDDHPLHPNHTDNTPVWRFSPFLDA